MHFDPEAFARSVNRRTFLTNSAYGLGGIAFASLRARADAAIPKASAGKSCGVITQPHFPIKAKRIIHLCMAGGPSQFESLDFKPELKKLHQKPFPESFTKGQQLAQLQNMKLEAMGSFVEFQKHGTSGQEISALFPHIGGVADDLCIVRSMFT
jgi:hypothetical protein